MRIEEMMKTADLFASMSSQAFSTSETFYQAPYHETTYHPERKTVAANMRKVLEGSNHHELPTCNKSKQDPYSLPLYSTGAWCDSPSGKLRHRYY